MNTNASSSKIFPAVSKPWEKYYSKEALSAPLPTGTLWDTLVDAHKEHLDEVAFRYYGTAWSRRRFFGEVHRITAALTGMGIKKGDFVTVMSMHTPETVASIYAINAMGAVANIVYMTLSTEELLSILKNTESKVILLLDKGAERLGEAVRKIEIPIILLSIADSMPALLRPIVRSSLKLPEAPMIPYKKWLKPYTEAMAPSFAHDGNAPAIAVYTSGTTASPKAVILSSRAFNSLAIQLNTSGKNYRRGETCLMIVPPFLGFGITILHLILMVGLDITLWIDIDSKKVAKEYTTLKPNRFVSGPPMVDAIMARKVGDLSSVMDFSGGGEAMALEKEKELNDFLAAHGSKAVYTTAYGMTELGSAISSTQLSVNRPGSVGIPLPLTNIRVVDPQTLEDLPCGVEGELWVSSPNVFIEYFRNPDETKNVRVIDANGTPWVRTGDLCLVDEDGFIFLKGRIKRCYVTTGGDNDNAFYKLFPDRIEELLESHPAVHLAGVICIPHPDRVNVPIAFVMPKPDNTIPTDKLLEELESMCRKDLPTHNRPTEIRIIGKIPMTASGKVNYRALEDSLKK